MARLLAQNIHAAHSCGKGSSGCVAKRHLSWKTPSENEADKLVHGTSPRGARCGTAKLTEAEIREIRMLKGYVPQREIAEMYETSQGHVSGILSEQKWGWLD